MKPWGRFMFILIAYSITLLHTAIPHHHALGGGNGEPVLIHNGCALPHGQGGLLQRVFATDLGVGHLETFKQASDKQLQSSFEVVAILLPRLTLPPICKTIPTFFDSAIGNLKRQQLLSCATAFRGPPAH